MSPVQMINTDSANIGLSYFTITAVSNVSKIKLSHLKQRNKLLNKMFYCKSFLILNKI